MARGLEGGLAVIVDGMILTVMLGLVEEDGVFGLCRLCGLCGQIWLLSGLCDVNWWLCGRIWLLSGLREV